jgi:hypothetical protein
MTMYFRAPEDRPLRAAPVRRDELLTGNTLLIRTMPLSTLLIRTMPLSTLLIRTMPLGTWRLVEHREESEDEDAAPLSYAVADPDLWRPVLEELAAIAEQDRQQIEMLFREHPEFDGLLYRPEAPTLPGFFLDENVLEYRCHECNEWTLGIIGRRRVHVCSDRCAEAHRKHVYQDWRFANPRDPETVNPTRAKRRAEVRAGRKCEHCGKPIDAERSTKRFCSDICRVRAHRATAAAAP